MSIVSKNSPPQRQSPPSHPKRPKMIWDVFVLKFPYLIFWVITRCDDTKHGWEPQNGVWEALSIDSYSKRHNVWHDSANFSLQTGVQIHIRNRIFMDCYSLSTPGLWKDKSVLSLQLTTLLNIKAWQLKIHHISMVRKDLPLPSEITWVWAWKPPTSPTWVRPDFPNCSSLSFPNVSCSPRTWKRLSKPFL